MLAKIDFFYNFFETVFKNTKLESRDFFDVLIIAFLIYIVIELLKETHSASMFIGVLTLLGLYGVALFFDLPLTSLVLRSFFGIFLVVIAVVFQRELRRFFAAFGLLGLSRRFIPLAENNIEIISHAVGKLAQEKMGALIVLPGKELIGRHIEGGYGLGGEISEPLLLSLFDKTSPGHDGAVIIMGNKIKKFSAHLPLAEKIEEIRKFGLRHRAALGLSERSDALTIVVSEERGVISIAIKGRLIALENEKELEEKLIDFYREKFPKKNLANFFKKIVKNAILMATSFFISLVIFSLVHSQFAFVQKNFAVTPEFKNMLSDIIISDIVPQEIILTLEGRGSDFSNLNSEDLKITFDIGAIPNAAKIGWHRLPVSANDIGLPFKFSLVNIEPSSIQIQVFKSTSVKK